jgi:hypothetical protein
MQFFFVCIIGLLAPSIATGIGVSEINSQGEILSPDRQPPFVRRAARRSHKPEESKMADAIVSDGAAAEAQSPPADKAADATVESSVVRRTGAGVKTSSAGMLEEMWVEVKDSASAEAEESHEDSPSLLEVGEDEIAFYLTGHGEICPTGEEITCERSCQEAAQQVQARDYGYPLANQKFVTRSNEHLPPGCLFTVSKERGPSSFMVIWNDPQITFNKKTLSRMFCKAMWGKRRTLCTMSGDPHTRTFDSWNSRRPITWHPMHADNVWYLVKTPATSDGPKTLRDVVIEAKGNPLFPPPGFSNIAFFCVFGRVRLLVK